MNDLDYRDAKVLIVDDQDLNIALLSGMLKKAGFRNRFSTSDPLAAAELFQRVAPHVVLLDIEMPKLDGFGVLEQLRALSSEVLVPVVVLTAHTAQAIRLRAIEAGATDFLTKPFDGMEVLGRVRNMATLGMMARRIADENRRLEEAVRARTARLEQMVQILRSAESALAAKARTANESCSSMVQLVGRAGSIFDDLAGRLLAMPEPGAEVTHTATQIKRIAIDIELLADAAQDHLAISRQSVNLREALQIAIAALDTDAKTRQIVLSANLESLPETVTADPQWLGEAVRRVLMEAMDATPTPGAVLVDWAPDGDGGLLRVIDGGATLSAEQARELATPFDISPLINSDRSAAGTIHRAVFGNNALYAVSLS
jgi:DNA-binding response OmpR family regulator